MTSVSVLTVVLCGISPLFGRLSLVQGKITHVLLTRAPLYRGLLPFACDLHVLSAPPTFVLSQDQTLQFGDLSPHDVSAASRERLGSMELRVDSSFALRHSRSSNPLLGLLSQIRVPTRGSIHVRISFQRPSGCRLWVERAWIRLRLSPRSLELSFERGALS